MITGVNGMLGTNLFSFFKSQNNFEVHGIGRSERTYNDLVYHCGNLVDEDFINSLPSDIDIVIHTAAQVNLSECEKNKDEAYKLHVDSTEKLAKKYSKSIFLYFSTDSVFDGNEGNYKESDLPNPLNVYSRTKYLGEKFSNSHKSAYIFRLNIYGFSSPMGNSLFEWGYKNLISGQEINGYGNVFFNPLYIGQVGPIINDFLQKNFPYGVYNLGSDKKLSKFEFLKSIQESFSINGGKVVKSNADFSNDSVIRPYDTSLNIDLISSLVPSNYFNFESGMDALKNDILILKKNET